MAQSDGLPHKQKVYSDLAIEVILSLKILFKLPLRAAQGLAMDLIEIMGLKLMCPNYSTLSRRAKSLKIDLGVRKTHEPIHLLVDSTGTGALRTMPHGDKSGGGRRVENEAMEGRISSYLDQIASGA